MGLAGAILLYCRMLPAHDFVFTTRHMMGYLGFVHFAVGYYFFFTSPSTHEQIMRVPWATLAKIAACVGAGILVFQNPRSMVVVYTLFYLHAAENGVYHIFQISRSPGTHRNGLSTNALFPLLLVLGAARLTPAFVTGLDAPFRLLQFATLAGYVVILRMRLPATDWAAGWPLVVRNHVLVACFIIVAFFFPEGGTLYDYFIIWHYIIWFIYTWFQKRHDRARLVWSHVICAAAYKGLFLMADANRVFVHPLALWILIGTASFMAQTTCHILLTFVFRSYPKAAV